jgi:hypothetical protein
MRVRVSKEEVERAYAHLQNSDDFGSVELEAEVCAPKTEECCEKCRVEQASEIQGFICKMFICPCHTEKREEKCICKCHETFTYKSHGSCCPGFENLGLSNGLPDRPSKPKIEKLTELDKAFLGSGAGHLIKVVNELIERENQRGVDSEGA